MHLESIKPWAVLIESLHAEQELPFTLSLALVDRNSKTRG